MRISMFMYLILYFRLFHFHMTIQRRNMQADIPGRASPTLPDSTIQAIQNILRSILLLNNYFNASPENYVNNAVFRLIIFEFI